MHSTENASQPRIIILPLQEAILKSGKIARNASSMFIAAPVKMSLATLSQKELWHL
jgi:hypothetical protein